VKLSLRSASTLLAGVTLVHAAVGQAACPAANGPDLALGDIEQLVANYNSVGGLEALSLGTTSCNLGTVWIDWIATGVHHPVITGNLYRYTEVDGAGRFEQVGLGWVTHGFFALSGTFCCTTCTADPGGTHLGVGCSSPDTAGANGSQGLMGPRSEVDAFTGAFPYPPTHPSGGNRGRIEVLTSDLAPTSGGPSPRYFGVCQAIAADDAAAGNSADNCAYRELAVAGSGSAWTFTTTSPSRPEKEALEAWAEVDPSVRRVEIRIPNEGLLVLASRVTPLAGGRFRYEYALENLDSDLAVGAFTVPIPAGGGITNVGFHDVAHRGGDGVGGVDQDGTDWPSTQTAGVRRWSTATFAQDPNANAIRWGTTYNFRFDALVGPGLGTVAIGTFKDGGTIYASADVPGGAVPGMLFCSGDGSLATPCPCGNTGIAGHGCANSQNPSGALLASTGTASPDTVVLTSSGELPTSLSIFLQSAVQAPNGIVFGDGTRCVTGALKRLYVKNAVGGTAAAPAAGDPSITARSAALGDSIAPGSTRFYQTYYRDGNATFCPSPPGSSFNVSSGQIIVW